MRSARIRAAEDVEHRRPEDGRRAPHASVREKMQYTDRRTMGRRAPHASMREKMHPLLAMMIDTRQDEVEEASVLLLQM